MCPFDNLSNAQEVFDEILGSIKLAFGVPEPYLSFLPRSFLLVRGIIIFNLSSVEVRLSFIYSRCIVMVLDM